MVELISKKNKRIPQSSEMSVEVDQSEICCFDAIGSGSYAVVYKARWRGLVVAVKRYTKPQHTCHFENEARELSKAAHPNIICLIAKSVQQRSLIMEYSEIGSLQEVLDKGEYNYNTGHAVSWARQAADGVTHLHNSKVLHRDLKPDNMLLFKRGLLLKLSDFGTACILRTELTQNRGSPAWMAPEVWFANDYNEKCDVYSWAVVFWQIITRRQPFKGLDAHQIMWKVEHGGKLELLKKCPTVIQKLIAECLDGDKSKRPCMAEVASRMAILQKLFPGWDIPIDNLQLSQGDDSNSAISTGSCDDDLSLDEKQNAAIDWQMLEDLGSLLDRDETIAKSQLTLDMASTLKSADSSARNSADESLSNKC